ERVAVSSHCRPSVGDRLLERILDRRSLDQREADLQCDEPDRNRPPDELLSCRARKRSTIRQPTEDHDHRLDDDIERRELIETDPEPWAVWPECLGRRDKVGGPV